VIGVGLQSWCCSSLTIGIVGRHTKSASSSVRSQVLDTETQLAASFAGRSASTLGPILGAGSWTALSCRVAPTSVAVADARAVDRDIEVEQLRRAHGFMA